MVARHSGRCRNGTCQCGTCQCGSGLPIWRSISTGNLPLWQLLFNPLHLPTKKNKTKNNMNNKSLLINILAPKLGPSCRKCDGLGYYCVQYPLVGDPPDNRRSCEICGGEGYERIKQNPVPENPRVLTSFHRDELIDLLRSIITTHIRYAGWSSDPVRKQIEESLQRMAAK